jgi:glutamate-1-semialdehyde 2,1-aminomutase
MDFGDRNMNIRNRSDRLYARSKNLLPGGVNSPVRAFAAVGCDPVFIAKANGSVITDVDGCHYIDFCQSWGPLILGHTSPDVITAVQEAAGRGLSFGACHSSEGDLADLILSGYPDFDRVRLVNSGTEAVMTALRIARAVTGRSLVLKFEGGYHGHSDGLLVKAGSGLATTGLASSAGVAPSVAATTVVARLNDEESVASAFEAYGNDIAATLIEPVPANNGLLEQRSDYLKHLATATRRAGALLIADEVITGFRLQYGASLPAIELQPDLVTLGKIIGGGMPIGAVAGGKQLMENLAPTGSVYQAGTLSGNPLSVAAGIATLTELSKPSSYARLERLGSLMDQVVHTSGSNNLEFVRLGSMFWPYFCSGKPRAAHEIKESAINHFNDSYTGFLDKGFYLPPSGYEVCFLSTAHSETECNSLIKALISAADNGLTGDLKK